MILVSWNDCVAFCTWLSGQERETYGLPTEAQWEYACRSGSTARYCYGSDTAKLEQYAWRDKNSGNKPNPVCQKLANGFGLFDLHGNVAELCVDWYDEDYYGSSPLDDPTGPTVGSERVCRGGCWRTDGAYCRSADRSFIKPDRRATWQGFRVTCSVDASDR